MTAAEDRILTSLQTAEYLGVTDNRMAKHRMTGTGPAFFKLGRSVRYRWSAIQEWIDAQTATSTDEYAA